MANVPTVAHAEGTPAGGDYIRDGDDRIREFKTQVREIVGVDHKFDSSGQGSTWGHHKWMTLIEIADLGSGAVSATILGSQTVSGKGELTYVDEDDNDIQLTKAGKSYANLLADAAEFDTSAAPTTDVMVANKKYVDDQKTPVAARVKGWVVFDGTDSNPITKADGHNISGTITKNSTGDYTISWTTDFGDADYVITGSVRYNTSGGVAHQHISVANVASNPAAGSVRINTVDKDGTKVDCEMVCVEAIGNQ